MRRKTGREIQKGNDTKQRYDLFNKQNRGQWLLPPPPAPRPRPRPQLLHQLTRQMWIEGNEVISTRSMVSSYLYMCAVFSNQQLMICLLDGDNDDGSVSFHQLIWLYSAWPRHSWPCLVKILLETLIKICNVPSPLTPHPPLITATERERTDNERIVQICLIHFRSGRWAHWIDLPTKACKIETILIIKLPQCATGIKLNWASSDCHSARKLNRFILICMYINIYSPFDASQEWNVERLGALIGFLCGINLTRHQLRCIIYSAASYVSHSHVICFFKKASRLRFWLLFDTLFINTLSFTSSLFLAHNRINVTRSNSKILFFSLSVCLSFLLLLLLLLSPLFHVFVPPRNKHLWQSNQNHGKRNWLSERKLLSARLNYSSQLVEPPPERRINGAEERRQSIHDLRYFIVIISCSISKALRRMVSAAVWSHLTGRLPGRLTEVCLCCFQFIRIREVNLFGTNESRSRWWLHTLRLEAVRLGTTQWKRKLKKKKIFIFVKKKKKEERKKENKMKIKQKIEQKTKGRDTERGKPRYRMKKKKKKGKRIATESRGTQKGKQII